MTVLTHRERVVRALGHEEPDRVPCDLGQGPASGIHVAAYARLTEHLDIDEEPGDVRVNRRDMDAVPSESVLRRFDVDLRKLPLGKPEVNPESDVDENSYRDEWGVVWARPEDGHFINREGPFQAKEPTTAQLERYRWPAPRDPGRTVGLLDRARKLREETDYAVVLNLPYSIVRECQRVRGFAEWMEDLLLNPALAEAFMDYSLMVSAGIAEHVLAEVGEYVDVVSFPDDLGFQDRPYMRPDLYRKMVKPYHRRLVEAIKSKTSARVLIHSDGSVYSLIGDFVDIGIDALNPVQVSAKSMDSATLKREFGQHMCFWGGIDTHRVLPMGTPEDVRDEVRRRLRDLSAGGGYVVGPVHNIQAEVPPENVVAMYDSARALG